LKSNDRNRVLKSDKNPGYQVTTIPGPVTGPAIIKILVSSSHILNRLSTPALYEPCPGTLYGWFNRLVNHLLDQFLDRLLDHLLNRLLNYFLNRFLTSVLSEPPHGTACCLNPPLPRRPRRWLLPLLNPRVNRLVNSHMVSSPSLPQPRLILLLNTRPTTHIDSIDSCGSL
jgi:hypothetical protein